MKEPGGQTKNAKRLRRVAKGYRMLRKDKATFYDSAADVLEQIETNANAEARKPPERQR